jgi:hypothetical protein
MATYKENRQIAQGATVEVLKVYTSAEATEAEDGTEVVLKGKVTEINTAWSDQYKNITVTITDGAGTFYLYRLSTNVQVGDEVVVFGKVGSYKGSKQLAQGGTAVITKAASETPAGPTFIEVPIDSDKWDQCALKENWQGKDKVQYRGFAAGSTHGAGGFMFRYGENSTVPATDISGMKYIEFDVYVSHIDMIAEAQFSFELSSSGTSDKEESCKKFYGKDTGWVVGWNHVKWNLSDFTEHGPDNKAMDATKWNFIRWYNDTTITIGEEKLKVAIVNIKFTNDDYVAEEKPAAPEMPAKPTGDALATFTFGDNGEAAHVDGQDLGETASYTSGDYKLDLTGMSKVYGPATDAKGNSCIKMGTSSKVGTFSFTVAEGVNKVVIRIASYKANVTKINVNGTVYDISANKSNDGSYFEIVVDTSTTKTVTIATVEGACRAMIDSIAYYA